MYLRPADLSGADNTELRCLIGDKAAQLAQFHWEAADSGGPPVPTFQVATVDSLNDFYRLHWTNPPMGYPMTPAAQAVPAEIGALMAGFGPYARRRGLLGGPDRAVLRSSFVWPGSKPRVAGVDTSVLVGSAEPAVDGEEAAMSRMAAGLFKAYTTLCLADAGLEPEGTRPAGIIAMPLLKYVYQGTAYVHDGGIAAEVASPRRNLLAGSPAELAALAAISLDGAANLFSALRAWAEPGRLIELEFLVAADEKINLMQRRRMPLVYGPDRAGGPTVLHSPGTYSGDAIDLRGVARDDPALDELIASAAGRAMIVPLAEPESARAIDAFGVIWRYARLGAVAKPGAVILTNQDGTQAGMLTHIRWAITHALASTMVVRALSAALPGRQRAVRVESDGIHALVRPI